MSCREQPPFQACRPLSDALRIPLHATVVAASCKLLPSSRSGRATRQWPAKDWLPNAVLPELMAKDS